MRALFFQHQVLNLFLHFFLFLDQSSHAVSLLREGHELVRRLLQVEVVSGGADELRGAMGLARKELITSHVKNIY